MYMYIYMYVRIYIHICIPLSFAMSVVSEISAKGARNVTGCDANAVTYNSADSPFYHTLIAAKGYAYS